MEIRFSDFHNDLCGFCFKSEYYRRSYIYDIANSHDFSRLFFFSNNFDLSFYFNLHKLIINTAMKRVKYKFNCITSLW